MKPTRHSTSNKFSVVIPTHGRDETLANSLPSVILQCSQFQRSELIIVRNDRAYDDGRFDEILDRADFESRVICNETPGLLTGRHVGLEEASGNIICYLDDDVSLADGWAKAIEDAFLNPSVQLVGGPSVPDKESVFPDWLNEFWRPFGNNGRILCELSLIDLRCEEPCEIDPCYVWGLNYSIRRTALVKHGGFHPDCVPAYLQHFQGDGETGLSQKLSRSGNTCVYHPNAKVTHRIGPERLTLAYFEQRHFYQGVCDSYSKLRRHFRSLSPEKTMRARMTELINHGKAIVRNIPFVIREPIYKINHDSSPVSLCERAYERGIRFHTECVMRSPRLRDWVARDDYFDYCYPRLEWYFSRPTHRVHET